MIQLADKDTFTIICGDISGSISKTCKWIDNNIHNGLFVAGNHMFYDEHNLTIEQILSRYSTKYPLKKNVSFLNNNHKVINDIVFIGSTLWTDYKLFGAGSAELYKYYATRCMNDFKYGRIENEGNIPSLSINSNNKDKSLKNRGSHRIVPIHPKLIDMGFLLYVEYQRRHKQDKLFSELTKTKRNGYGKIVQSWFARYLDSLNITGQDKVFHSFRHTFETMAVEKKIPAEYQNAICGWTDQGVGQRIYGRKKDINVMREEIGKINYPINREMNELKNEFMNSYVVKGLR